MTFREKLEEVKKYLDRSPFTREEIEMAFAYFDDSEYFKPNNVFALSVALSYARDNGDKELQDELYMKYQRAKNKIIKTYEKANRHK